MIKKQPFKLTLILISLFLTLTLFSCTQDILKDTNVYILAVALNYDNMEPTSPRKVLNGTVNDVLELSTCLEDIYKTKSKDKANVNVEYMIQKGIGTNKFGRYLGSSYPTKENLINTLNSYKNKLNKDDTFIFIYAGHGQVVDDDGNICLTKKDGDYYTFELFKMSELFSLIDSFSCNSIAILDCCNSGYLSENSSTTSEGVPDAFKNMFSTKEYKSLTVMAACRSYELSSEDKYFNSNHDHGLFTASLLQVLGWNDKVPRNIKINETIEGTTKIIDETIHGKLSTIPKRNTVSEIYSKVINFLVTYKDMNYINNITQHPTLNTSILDAVLVP